MRFSEFFNINKSQAELDFVDIPLNTDIPLFIDPYAISIQRGDWFANCNNYLVDFFEKLVITIKDGKIAKSVSLLSNLHEANDTHLGLSRHKPQGKGIGAKFAKDLYGRLSKSKAVKTGKLSDLSEMELMIPYIGADRISDMTTNIIRSELILYTQAQCNYWDIQLLDIPSQPMWNIEERRWYRDYVSLPVYKNKGIVLVPKRAVRHRMIINHQKFYNHFMLSYLQTEHLNSNSALVELLVNGKRRVTKKKLKEHYSGKKSNIAEFIEEKPAVLKKYKAEAATQDYSLLDETIESHQKDPRYIDYDSILKGVDKIGVGRKFADEYHNYIMGALEAIFYPELMYPEKEFRVHNGRKRVDIKFTNASKGGFFSRLNRFHRVKCPLVFFECKNYSSDLQNPEYDQITGRFNKERGRFGIIVCRRIEDLKSSLKKCKDILNDGRGYVLVLDDNDIKLLIDYKSKGQYELLERHLDKKFEELIA